MFKNFSNREYELSIEIARLSSGLSDKNSKRYFNLGFLNRFFMIQYARNKIIEIISLQETKPLEHSEGIWLKLLLNSFYINLRGAIDNLAWFLNYEYKLQESISEEPGKGSSRRFTDLFGVEFINELKKRNLALSENLSIYNEWYADLKKFRDPAAHRIPLAFTQSVLDNDDLNKASEISNKINEIYAEFDKRDFSKIDELSELNFSWISLGRFEPIIITSESSKYEVYSAPKQFDEDFENFLNICEIIIKNNQ